MLGWEGTDFRVQKLYFQSKKSSQLTIICAHSWTPAKRKVSRGLSRNHDIPGKIARSSNSRPSLLQSGFGEKRRKARDKLVMCWARVREGAWTIIISSVEGFYWQVARFYSEANQQQTAKEHPLMTSANFSDFLIPSPLSSIHTMKFPQPPLQCPLFHDPLPIEWKHHI